MGERFETPESGNSESIGPSKSIVEVPPHQEFLVATMEVLDQRTGSEHESSTSRS